jgi:hypothetical protein
MMKKGIVVVYGDHPCWIKPGLAAYMIRRNAKIQPMRVFSVLGLLQTCSQSGFLAGSKRKKMIIGYFYLSIL